jgi:hypothetical protein
MTHLLDEEIGSAAQNYTISARRDQIFRTRGSAPDRWRMTSSLVEPSGAEYAMIGSVDLPPLEVPMSIRFKPTRMFRCSAIALITGATAFATSACAKHDAALADSAGGTTIAPPVSSSSATVTAVRGTVAAVSDSAINITTTTGQQQIHVDAPLRVYTRMPSDLAHVTANAFVGITSVAQPDGSQRATEIHIFPEALRGTGEGSRMMDDASGGSGNRMTNGSVAPSSRMTNGSVAPSSRMTNGTVAATSGGARYTIQYQGGTQTIDIPSDVSVTVIVPTQTKPALGANVIVMATTGPDGRLTTSALMLSGAPVPRK